eukprot:226467-Rhodomonas_salina.2
MRPTCFKLAWPRRSLRQVWAWCGCEARRSGCDLRVFGQAMPDEVDPEGLSRCRRRCQERACVCMGRQQSSPSSILHSA